MNNQKTTNSMVNVEQKPIERIKNYIEQVGNPYCYQYNGVTVRISFSGKSKIEDCIKAVLLRDNEYLAGKGNGALN